jgi:ethanolamine permease
MVIGIITLIIASLLVLVLNSGIAPGAAGISTSNEPLFEGFKTIFGDGMGTKLLSLIAVAGLIASFHTIIFAYGRQIYSLSRAGYFPRQLSLTHRTRQTPHVAMIAGATIGYLVALAIHLLGQKSPVGAVLLNMAVFGAVVSYILQMISYILLRVRLPHIERPYRSPTGIAGAIFVMAVAATTLVALFVVDPVYRNVVIGAAIWYALGLLYFALYGRRQLVRAPEEEFAMREMEKAKRPT